MTIHDDNGGVSRQGSRREDQPSRPRLSIRVQTALSIAALTLGAVMFVAYLIAEPVLEKHYPVAQFSGVVVANGFSAGCATADGLGAVRDGTCAAVAVRVTDSDSPEAPVGSTRTIVGSDHELGQIVQSKARTNPSLAGMTLMLMGGVFMLVAGAGWVSYIGRQRRRVIAPAD